MDFTLKSTRDAFGEAMLDISTQDTNVVALTADLADSLRLLKFKEKFPERFFDMGVAEQNMVGVAAGLALDGMIPFAASFAVFNPGRNWDQIRVSIAYNNANVKIIGGYVGFSNGKDGATHQALEDIALMRVLPNMTVLDPCDYDETKEIINAAYKYVGPVYIRIRRDPVLPIKSLIYQLKDRYKKSADSFTFDVSKFEIGKGRLLKNGNDITFIACGQMVHLALDAAAELNEQNISARVINMSSIKPIDKDIIINAAKETKAIITIEEHQVNGGLGSAVCEVVSQNFPVKMKLIGVNDEFGETGTQEQLLESKNLTKENIIQSALDILK